MLYAVVFMFGSGGMSAASAGPFATSAECRSYRSYVEQQGTALGYCVDKPTARKMLDGSRCYVISSDPFEKGSKVNVLTLACLPAP